MNTLRSVVFGMICSSIDLSAESGKGNPSGAKDERKYCLRSRTMSSIVK